MTVHLKKLSVGSESLASLRQWQEARRKAGFELMRVRIFQGWRYLEVKDAPADLPMAADGDEAMPPELVAELRELGLL